MSTIYKKLLKKSRRAFRAFSLKVFPKVIVNRIFRSQLDLNIVNRRSEFSFELASDTKTLFEALELVQNAFYRMGYSDKEKVRLTPYHLLPRTVVLCVKFDSKVIASMTIIPHSSFGLPLQTCVSIDDVLRPNTTVELSALAVDPQYAGQRGEVLYNLIKYMYHCNVDLLEAEMEVIGVNPIMVPLYQSLMLFKPIPNTSTTTYGFANGAKVEPMYFDLSTAKEQYSKVYGGRPKKTNLLKFFLADPPSHFIFPDKEALDSFSPQNNAESLVEILSWRPEVISELNESSYKKLVALHYANPDCQRVLEESRNKNA